MIERKEWNYDCLNQLTWFPKVEIEYVISIELYLLGLCILIYIIIVYFIYNFFLYYFLFLTLILIWFKKFKSWSIILNWRRYFLCKCFFGPTTFIHCKYMSSWFRKDIWSLNKDKKKLKIFFLDIIVLYYHLITNYI